MNQELYKVLTESDLSESPTLTHNMVRRYSEGEQVGFSAKLIMSSLSLVNKLSSKNKNIRAIDKSNGDFSKYEASKSIKQSITGVRRMLDSSYRSKELPELLTKLELNIAILEKYKREFTQAYRNDDVLVKSIYRSIIAAVSLLTLKINTSYVVYDEESVRLTLYDGDLQLTKKDNYKSLEKFIEHDRKGELKRIFRLEDEITQREKEKKNSPLNESFFLSEEDSGGGNPFVKFLSDLANELIDDEEPKGEDGEAKEKTAATTLIVTVVVILAVVLVVRKVITEYYQFRVNIAKALEESAEILYIEIPTIDDPELRDKQQKRADKLAEWSNKIDVEEVNVERQSNRTLDKFDGQVKKDFDKELKNDGNISFGF